MNRAPLSVRLPSQGNEVKTGGATAPLPPNSQTSNPPPRTSPKDADLVAAFLPSGFHPYTFKDLYLRPVLGRHQARFASAAALDNVRLVVDTVTSLIGGDIDSLDLTPNDFQYVMYWLRTACFGTIPFTVKAVCHDVEHVSKVTNGELPRESLITVDYVTKTRLKEVVFDPTVLEGFDDSAVKEFGWHLGHPRQRDVVELVEMVDRDDFRELEFLSDFASCLQAPDGHYVSLLERVLALRDAPPEVLRLLGKYHALVTSYGVEETIITRCKECGAGIVTEVPFSAAMFSWKDS